MCDILFICLYGKGTYGGVRDHYRTGGDGGRGLGGGDGGADGGEVVTDGQQAPV